MTDEEGHPEDFDWSKAGDDLLQPTTAAIAVYFNPGGDVVIRQQAVEYGEEDSFVYVPFNKVRSLIEKLRVMLDDGGPNTED
jgi:hypothetical protein